MSVSWRGMNGSNHPSPSVDSPATTSMYTPRDLTNSTKFQPQPVFIKDYENEIPSNTIQESRYRDLVPHSFQPTSTPIPNNVNANVSNANTQLSTLNSHNITGLLSVGVPESEVEALLGAGYARIKDLHSVATRILVRKTGLSETQAITLKKAALMISPVDYVMNAIEYETHVEKADIKLGTGSLRVDRVLNGGIKLGMVSEFFGESMTGKTAFAHTLCVTCQIPFLKTSEEPSTTTTGSNTSTTNTGSNTSSISSGGISGGSISGGIKKKFKIAYMDTEGTFSPKRIRTIASARGIGADSILSNITVLTVENTEWQLSAIENLNALFSNDDSYQLLIVDSIIYRFLLDFPETHDFLERQKKLTVMMNRLVDISKQYNVAVVLTNQAYENFGIETGPRPMGGTPLELAGLRVWLKTTSMSTNSRELEIYKSVDGLKGHVPFLVVDGGISDADQHSV